MDPTTNPTPPVPQTPPSEPPSAPADPTPQAAPETPGTPPVQPEASTQTPSATPVSASPVATSAEDPGKTMGIISLILPFIGLSPVGLILGIIARKKSKAAGHNNGVAKAGIIVSIIGLIIALVVVSLLVVAALQLNQKCKELGPGVHREGAVTYTCS